MDPTDVVREEQEALRAALVADPTGSARLARYLDLEERVLFDSYARHVSDDDVLGRARDEQAALVDLVGRDDVDVAELRARFDRHADLVMGEVLPPLEEQLDRTQRADLGDALEEARQSWDEHDQPPHVRVGVEDRPGDRAPGEGRQGGTAPPGEALAGEDGLRSAPEPNEPA